MPMRRGSSLSTDGSPLVRPQRQRCRRRGAHGSIHPSTRERVVTASPREFTQHLFYETRGHLPAPAPSCDASPMHLACARRSMAPPHSLPPPARARWREDCDAL
eukprot:8363481-Pyramimonas_sp.AAC.1